MGELRCHDGSCVSDDQYCDGEADCAGGEDEPAHCTREYCRHDLTLCTGL